MLRTNPWARYLKQPTRRVSWVVRGYIFYVTLTPKFSRHLKRIYFYVFPPRQYVGGAHDRDTQQS
jgi:hypothetical protein